MSKSGQTVLAFLSVMSAVFVAQRLWHMQHEKQLLRLQLDKLERQIDGTVAADLEGPLLKEDPTPLIPAEGNEKMKELVLGSHRYPKIQGQTDPAHADRPYEVSGWACGSEDGALPVEVMIYIDNHLITTVEARTPRDDGLLMENCNRPSGIDGSVNVGFLAPIPALPPGRHKLQVFARDFSKTGKLELSGSPRWITTEKRPHVMQELALRDKIIQEKNAQLATLTANLHALEPNHVQVAHRGPAWVQKESGRGKEEPLSFSSLKAAEQESEALSSAGGHVRTSHSRPVFGANHAVDTKFHQPGGEWEVEPTRPKLVGFVGINTGLLTKNRRNVLRKTWMPTKGALKKLEEEHGLMVRFVIGYSNLKSPDALDLALDEESRLHGDIIRVQHQDTYDTLSTKTMLFFSHFSQLYPAEFYIKVDDDIYLNLEELSTMLKSHRDTPRVYIGCMKSGIVINDKRFKWYEPEWWRFGNSGNSYYQHATGQIYALSSQLADYIHLNDDLLHRYANEDTTIGALMMGLDVQLINDRRLCCSNCKQQTEHNMCVAVWQFACNGVCNLEQELPRWYRECHPRHLRKRSRHLRRYYA